MSEKTRKKVRVKSMHIGDVITTEAGVRTAQFATQLPFTLRDQAVEFTEAEPEEDELFAHESDAPLDVEFVGQGISFGGTFIAPTNEQLVALMGGKVVDKAYHHKAKKLPVEKAIKITCYDDSVIIIPRAKGYVLFNASVGKDGKSTFPFKFKCLPGSQDWDVDVIW